MPFPSRPPFRSKLRPGDLWALGVAFGFIALVVAGFVPHVPG